MGSTVKLGALLTATVLASGVYYASTAVAGGTSNTPGVVHTTNAGTTPPRVFAVVSSTGSKIRGKAVASTSHLSTGVYDVRFLRNITGCGWTGTIGNGATPFGGSTAASMISVSGRAGTNNGLFVQTFNSAGASVDLPFLVVVICS